MTKSRAGLRRRERDCVYVSVVEAIYSTVDEAQPWPAGTFLGRNRFPERSDDPFFDSEIERSGRFADPFVSIDLLTAPPGSELLAIVAGHRPVPRSCR
jgi:hypothetical protein